MHAFQKKHYLGGGEGEEIREGRAIFFIEQLNSLEKARRAYYSSHRSFAVHNRAEISHIFSTAFHEFITRISKTQNWIYKEMIYGQILNMNKSMLDYQTKIKKICGKERNENII